MNPLFTTIIFGLAASLCWGSGDFSGGLASRRAHASSVVLADYGVGFVVLAALALIWKEPLPNSADLLWGGLAGLAGVLGLLSFYTALSRGKMGIVAPVSAVLTATLPVLFSAFTAGLPTLVQLGGLALALLAIGLISRPERTTGSPEGIGLALLAGCGFGCFFILISRVNPATTFWPLAVARLTAVIVLLMMARLRRKPILLGRAEAPLVALAGILGAVGNAFSYSPRIAVA
jgi:drug/metabolite transporter (DMT)-like permease